MLKDKFIDANHYLAIYKHLYKLVNNVILFFVYMPHCAMVNREANYVIQDYVLIWNYIINIVLTYYIYLFS